MIPAKGWANKKIAVFGLARSGLAAVKSLLAGQANVIAWDDNVDQQQAAQQLGATVQDLSILDWKGIEGLVLSPGIPHRFPKPHPIVSQALQAGVLLVSDIDLLYQAQSSSQFIGITGTNGKSTTTALVAHLLKEAGYVVQMGGNIGRAALDLDPLPPEGIYVLELSSYQLEISHMLCLDSALFLNIKPDHIARHGSFKGYMDAKERVFNQVKGVKALNVDYPELYEMAKRHQKREDSTATVILFSCKDTKIPLHVQNGRLYDTERFPKKSINLLETHSLKAEHNWENALGAYAALTPYSIPFETLQRGFETFPGLAHRQETVQETNNILYVNDSKATNVDSSLQALKVFDSIFWILGGRAKEDDFTQALAFASKIRKAYVYGEARQKIKDALSPTLSLDVFDTLEQALRQAQVDARQVSQTSRPVVLLSPACASFDQYKNFEVRGDWFKKLVREMAS